jgi:hypothetical protein
MVDSAVDGAPAMAAPGDAAGSCGAPSAPEDAAGSCRAPAEFTGEAGNSGAALTIGAGGGAALPIGETPGGVTETVAGVDSDEGEAIAACGDQRRRGERRRQQRKTWTSARPRSGTEALIP